MNTALQTFYHWFWFSFAMAVVTGAILLFITRWRTRWLNYIAAEAAVWVKLGVPARWAESARRIEASRAFTLVVAVLFSVLLGVTAIYGGAYLHYKNKMVSSQKNTLSAPAASPGHK